MAFFAKISLVCIVVAAVSAAPQQYYPVAHVPVVPHPVAHVPIVPHPVAVPASPVVPINSQSYDLAPDNSYSFHYESADGSSRHETGQARAPQGSQAPGGIAVQGSYAYASPEGPVQVDYVADEFGYQPSGPIVHPSIQKAVADQVAFAKANPQPVPVYHTPVPAAVVHHVPVQAPVFHAPAVVAPVYHGPAVAPLYHAPAAVSVVPHFKA